MSEHYEVRLVNAVDLGDGPPEFAAGFTDEHLVVALHFEVGAGAWQVQSADQGMSFAKADRTIVVPRNNIALVEIWED